MAIKVTVTGDTATIRLGPKLDEGGEAGFREWLGKIPSPIVTFDLDDLEYLNSVGIGAWATFNAQLAKTKRLTFVRCRQASVDAMMAFTNLRAHGTVGSLYLHFECGGCRRAEERLATREILRATDGVVEEPRCQDCGTAMSCARTPDELMLLVSDGEG